MGLNIVLTDCNGELLDRIDDPKNLLHSSYPTTDETSERVLAKMTGMEIPTLTTFK